MVKSELPIKKHISLKSANDSGHGLDIFAKLATS